MVRKGLKINSSLPKKMKKKNETERDRKGKKDLSIPSSLSF